MAQNDALRIIFKKSLLDKVKVEELRDRAGVQSIFERHKILMERYYERAIISENPLLKRLFDNYKKFKKRNFIDEKLAIKNGDIVCLETLSLIRSHNKLCLSKNEKYLTTLCGATKVVKDFILDNYTVGGDGIT